MLVPLTTVVVLASCSASPSIEGVWSASDGSADKVIRSDGSCSGMYYNGGRVLDIGGSETCSISSRSEGGRYALVVEQSPNQETLTVRFDGDSMAFSSGGRQIVLTKR